MSHACRKSFHQERSKLRTFMGSLTLHKSANYDSAEGICRKIYQFVRDCPTTDTPCAC